MDTDTLLGEIIDRCVQRLANGEALDAVLRSYPEHAGDLRALLTPAQTMLTAAIPEARPAAASLALNRMLSEVQTAATRSRSRGFLLVWLGSLRTRPLAYQAVAVAGAVALFGGVSLGATAATGGAPSPVRRILRISSDSQRKVTLKGSIVSLQGDVLTLRPDAGAATDVRTIIIGASTKILRQDHPIARADLRPGDTVEIDGTIHNGDRIEATAIRADGAPVPAAALTASAAPDATAEVQLPEVGTPGADDRAGHETPGPAHSEGQGSEDTRTPASAGAAAAGETPKPPDDRPTAASGDGHEAATPAQGATTTPEQGTDHSGTPQPTEPGHTPEPTQKPATTPAPEPTERPASPHPPEPTEDH
jgi:hypothetical protein